MAHERLRYCAGKACDCHAKAPLGFGVVKRRLQPLPFRTEHKRTGWGNTANQGPVHCAGCNEVKAGEDFDLPQTCSTWNRKARRGLGRASWRRAAPGRRSVCLPY
jgi:hypothetical protein